MLIELLKDKYKTVSIVGMAKNAGKTVALNQLIIEAMEEEVVIGLTSIGRDGERQDVVTFTEKPMIYLPEGSLIATAETTFNLSEARMEILEVTDFNTSMGKVIIGRVIASGYVQIAGPCTNEDIKNVTDRMHLHGANVVVVDGALDRVSSASPAITEATLLSTGAVVSRDMDKVIDQTLHQVNLFRLKPVMDSVIREMLEGIFIERKIAVIDKEGVVEHLPIRTALNAGRKIGAALSENSRYVVVSGSLVSKTVTDIIGTTKSYKNTIIVVQDATKIFIGKRDWLYYKKLGVSIEVFNEINLLGVTANPYSPEGYYFDSKKFIGRLTSFLDGVPVLDVMGSEDPLCSI